MSENPYIKALKDNLPSGVYLEDVDSFVENYSLSYLQEFGDIFTTKGSYADLIEHIIVLHDGQEVARVTYVPLDIDVRTATAMVDAVLRCLLINHAKKRQHERNAT